MVLDEVVAGFTLLDRFRAWRHGRRTPSSESVAARFIRLFETHGVHRNQIPRFFGHNIQLTDLKNEDALLPRLSDDVLDAAATLFAVRREWLDGAEAQAHPRHAFYKSPTEFAEFIDSLQRKNSVSQISGLLIAPIELDRRSESLLVIHESVGLIGEKLIFRHHLCDSWPHSYWKSRAYLAACIAIAWKRSVYVRGIWKPAALIEGLADGDTLLGWNGEDLENEDRQPRWFPDDMLVSPESFLAGIDPEENNFGTRSALKLWLDLDQEGWMGGVAPRDVTPLFQAELKKYSE